MDPESRLEKKGIKHTLLSNSDLSELTVLKVHFKSKRKAKGAKT